MSLKVDVNLYKHTGDNGKIIDHKIKTDGDDGCS